MPASLNVVAPDVVGLLLVHILDFMDLAMLVFKDGCLCNRFQ